MIDISVGAIGAAVIAGLVSFLGLIISKEQKVSEFRQAWIDQLRKSFVAYLANINAICDVVRIQKSENKTDYSALIPHIKLLNEARNDIILRINDEEETSKKLRESMAKFDAVAEDLNQFTPAKIRVLEIDFIKISKDLLKFEWNRVKRGENSFLWSKRAVAATASVLAILFLYSWYFSKPISNNTISKSTEVLRIQGATSADRL
jgi:hypothetical protein